MPLQQKRRGSPRGGFSRRRRGDDGASLSVSHVESSDSGDESASAYESKYQFLLASLLDRLQLPPGADGDSDSDPVDPPNLPSDEIVEALAGSFFKGDDMRAALLEDQAYRYSRETQGRDSGELNSADVDMDLVDSADIGTMTDEEFLSVSAVLRARRTPLDDCTYLEAKEIGKLYLEHALHRIKACMLLKGKPIDKLDDAALRTKYPPELILDNKYFRNYEDDGTFGWYFDREFCKLASLSDYQRLVPAKYCGSEYYADWDLYRSFCHTHETDREFLLYYETIVKKIKWIEDYVFAKPYSVEWNKMESKVMHQALRIATSFPNIHLDLAYSGYKEYVWSVHCDVTELKELGDLFFEIWKRIIKQKKCFTDAVKEANDPDRFPLHQRTLKYELEHGCFILERQFHQCTVGITEQVPDYRVRELIAKELKYKNGGPWGYEQYARKKLKIAELLELIPKLST